jgi:hypothetical protein
LSRQRSTLFGHYVRALEAKDFEERLRALEADPDRPAAKPDAAFYQAHGVPKRLKLPSPVMR